jgi:hypothetical protein
MQALRHEPKPHYPACVTGQENLGEALRFRSNNIHASPLLTFPDILFLKMSSKDKIVIAFDLYGTLISTESIAKDLATHFGQEQANKIATLWRRFVSLPFWLKINVDSCRYQLEYTWRMNSMSTFSRSYMPRPSLIQE